MPTIKGTDNDDVLNGDVDAWNLIYGYDGNDTLNGSTGTDSLFGGEGDDTLNGNAGNDNLYGHEGADAHFGGDGFDTATVYIRGATTFAIDLAGTSTGGEAQGDTFANDIEKFWFKDGDAGTNVSIFGFDTADDINLASTNSNFVIMGKGGDDEISALSSVYANVGDLAFYGGAGNDKLLIQDSRKAALYGGTGDDDLELFESSGLISGGAGNDTIEVDNYGYGGFVGGVVDVFGGDGDDIIDAKGSNDRRTIHGDAGNDTINGGTGRDDIYGGAGKDILTMRRDDGIIEGGVGDDIFHLLSAANFASSRYVDLNIDGGKGADTLNIENLVANSTVEVNYDLSKVIIATPSTTTGFEFSFSNIEKFTAVNGILSFVGSDASAPVVEDDNLESKAEKVVTTKFQNGVNADITDSLGGGDAFDVWGFFARVPGKMTVTSYRQGDADSAVTYTINAEKGANTLYITPPDNWDGKQGYLLQMSFATASTAKEKAIEGFINTELATLFKLGVIDLKEVGAKLFKVMFENLDQANHAALMNGIGEKLGFVGKLIDFSVKVDTIHAAFQVSQQQGLRTSYVEVMDLLAGMAASSAGGFGGTVVGGPVGGIVGGFAAGIVYGTQLSNAVKQGAGDDFDILYFNQTGGGGQLPVSAAQSSAYDPADLVFDEDWYLTTYAEAKTAVESGDYPSSFSYYLAVGIEAGHPPNATAPVPNPKDLAIDLKHYDPQQAHYTALWTTGAGDMVGDALSQGERAMADELNSRRTVDASIDAGLSAVANRVARDWVLNQTDQLQVAGFTGGVSDWVDQMSDGQVFSDTLGDLTGLTAGLDSSVRILGAFTSRSNIDKIADMLVGDTYHSGLLLGDDTASLGIAEYGGLWVILADSNTNADDALDGIAVPKVEMTGTAWNDVVYAGLGIADVDLGGGHDRFVGGNSNDKARGGFGDDTLQGGNGKDVLDGGAGSDKITGDRGNDVLKGGRGNDQMTGGKGADDFVFGKKFGDDIITDFDAQSDFEDINLRKVTAITSFKDLQDNHMAQVGADVVISAGANSITLKNLDIDDLGAEDFLF